MKEPATPKTEKPTRKPKSRKPRKPAVMDPGIAAIRSEARDKVKAYRAEKVSDRLFRVIVEKRLPKMTPAHRQALFDVLGRECTPTLPITG